MINFLKYFMITESNTGDSRVIRVPYISEIDFLKNSNIMFSSTILLVIAPILGLFWQLYFAISHHNNFQPNFFTYLLIAIVVSSYFLIMGKAYGAILIEFRDDCLIVTNKYFLHTKSKRRVSRTQDAKLEFKKIRSIGVSEVENYRLQLIFDSKKIFICEHRTKSEMNHLALNIYKHLHHSQQDIHTAETDLDEHISQNNSRESKNTLFALFHKIFDK